MNKNRKHQAGVWLAFASGFFGEAVLHSASITGEDVSEADALASFLDAQSDAMKTLGLDTRETIKSYEAGRQLMRETRENGEKHYPPIDEDNPPNAPPADSTPHLRLMPPPDRKKN